MESKNNDEGIIENMAMSNSQLYFFRGPLDSISKTFQKAKHAKFISTFVSIYSD